MAVLNLSLLRGAITCPGAPELPFEGILKAQIARLPASAPIVVLVHGYKYSPAQSGTNPHLNIFSGVHDDPRPRLRSWPRGLGFTQDGVADGLCIGFAWPAGVKDNPRRIGRSAFARVYDRAADAGAALGRIMDAIATIAPEREVDLVAHSLGARVALAALGRTNGHPGQVILMGGAEFQPAARRSLNSPIARRARIYNITSRENDFYDFLFQSFGPPEHRGAVSLSEGLGDIHSNWIDLPIDRPEILPLFARRGAALAGPVRRICHWNFYTRPGALSLYSRMIRERHNWGLLDLKDQIARVPAAPRWSLLLPRLTGTGTDGPGQTTAA